MTIPPTILDRVIQYDGVDTEHLKIYYEHAADQFKVCHRCDKCNLDLGCYCYDTIDDAIYACKNVKWTCMKHTLEQLWVDYELAEEIDNVCGTNLVEAAMNTDCYASDETIAITDSITEEQAKRILDTVDWSDECDLDHAGEACVV